jgi:cobyrinic acid a,c-diamide synthase
MRLVVGGVLSHVGKINLVAGLIVGLKQGGFTILLFRISPDYIGASC